MSNEIQINASLSYDDDSAHADLQVTELFATVATKNPVYHRQSATTSDVAVNLGGLSSVGWFMLKNLDATNYVTVKSGVGGTVVGKMLPGETYGPVRLGSGMQAPSVIANTAACEIIVMACAV